MITTNVTNSEIDPEFESGFGMDDCKPTDAEYSRLTQYDGIEIVFRPPSEPFKPTGQKVDMWVHINVHDQNNEPCAPTIHPVAQKSHSDYYYLPQTLYRFHAYKSEAGNKIVYAHDINSSKVLQWDHFERDLKGLLIDNIICPYYEKYEQFRFLDEARNTTYESR